MPLLLLIISLLSWSGLALLAIFHSSENYIAYFYLLLCINLLQIIIFFIFPKGNKLPSRPLLLSKIVLNISFWSCIALALNAYQKSLTCLNCMRSYLNTHLQPSFGNDTWQNIKLFYQNHTRFWTMSGLLLLWFIIFILLQKKEKNK